MNATDLGNRPASEMTYRQAIVLALTAAYMVAPEMEEGDLGNADEWANAMADAILAREAQEASHD